MRVKKNKYSLACKSLMSVAMALPGIRPAKADSVITRPQSDFRYTRYDEGRSRYQIDIYQATLKIPLGPKMDLVVEANKDVMAGASTVYYHPSILNDADPGPITTLSQVRTGATIYDERSAGSFNVRFFGDDYNVSAGAGISVEHDYESKTLNLQYQKDFNKNNTELTWGYSLSDDAVKPVPYPLEPTARKTNRSAKITHTFGFSLRQDLSKQSLIQGNIQFIADKGFLDDPYKLVLIRGDARGYPGLAAFIPGGRIGPYVLAHDLRPSYRGTLATSIQFVHYIEPVDASLHLEYRYAQNTWDIRSHTFSLAYHQAVGDDWEVVPNFRYYTQKEAYFYSMVFDTVGNAPFSAKFIGTQNVASSDYRLAKFGSITSELKVNYKFLADKSGKMTFVIGKMNRRNNYYWGKNPDPINPDNNFRMFYMSAGLGFTF
jgi:hypothetical protein